MRALSTAMLTGVSAVALMASGCGEAEKAIKAGAHPGTVDGEQVFNVLPGHVLS